MLKAIVQPDLEGYLCAMVLRRERLAWADNARRALLEAAEPGLGRPTDVAAAGLRAALGASFSKTAALLTALQRELGRKALPPLARAHDDERLMLGIAAGIGVVPELGDLMSAVFREAEGRSMRWDVIVLWSRHLAAGSPGTELATAGAKLLVQNAQRPLNFKDAAALLWLSSEMLDTSSWQPDDEQLESLDAAVRMSRRIVVTECPSELDSLDAAMLLRGLSDSPIERIGRRSRIDAVLDVFDAFPACAEVLRQRPRKRTALEIKDEYDVQWLVQALLLPILRDIVPEDPASKVAGRSSRLDFTSKSARLGIEIKYVKKKSDTPRTRDELMVDERQYQEHPYVETVVVFVHDPNRHIGLAGREAFTRDLSGPVTIQGRTVKYFVRVG